MLGAEMSVKMVCNQDGCSTDKRDPCASPPCKRLKKAPVASQIIIDDDDEKTMCLLPNQNTNHTSPSEQSKQASVSDNCNETTSMETGTVIEANVMTTEKTNPPLPFANLKEETPVTDTSEVNSDFSSPKSTNGVHKSPTNSLRVSLNCGSILKFMQPVPPAGQQAKQNVLKTPSKSCEGNTVVKPSTPVNHVGSPETPTISMQSESPGPVLTPGKVNTPKSRTPVRKLSVEEKLKREEERLRKQKEREEMKQKKEQERLEQQELKKQREKERQEKKEEEEKEKKERLEKKDEEKKKRDEEKKRREDEKNLKNEEKRKKEEEQSVKKQKVQNSFASFFIRKEMTPSPKQKEQVKNESKFKPFELKPFMKLASTKPSLPLSEEAKQTLGQVLAEQVTSSTSLPQVKDELQNIKAELVRQRQMNDEAARNITDITKEEEDEIMIIDQELPDADAAKTTADKHRVNGVKAKLLQFHSNYRPAYFGTWRKKSLYVSPKQPFKKDVNLINYEVDSDEEWEEEEPGESLSNSEGEDEDNDGNGNDDENDGFFVPHGYLSDDEEVENIEEDETGDCKDGEEVARLPQHKEEDRMQRQLAKQKAWESEMKRQFKPMKPIAIGCIWDGEIPSILKKLEACSLYSGNIDPCVRKDNPVASIPCPSPSTYCNTAMPVPEEAISALIKLVHGSTTGLHKLMNIFRRKWTLETRKDDTTSEGNWEENCLISKRQLERKITSIARKEKRPMVPKARWYVHDSVLNQYKIEKSSLKINGFVDHHVEETTSSLIKVVPTTPTIKQFTQNTKSLVQTMVVDEESMDTGPV